MKKTIIVALLLGYTFIQTDEGDQVFSPLRGLTTEIFASDKELRDTFSDEDLKKIGSKSPLNSFAFIGQAYINLNQKKLHENNPETITKQLLQNPQILERLYLQSLYQEHTIAKNQLSAIMYELENGPEGEVAQLFKKDFEKNKENLLNEITMHTSAIKELSTIMHECKNNPEGEVAQSFKKDFEKNKENLLQKITQEVQESQQIVQEIIASQLNDYTKNLEDIEQASIELSLTLKINNSIVDKMEKPLIFDIPTSFLKNIREKAKVEKLIKLTKPKNEKE